MNAPKIRPVSRAALCSATAGAFGILLVTSTFAQAAPALAVALSSAEVPDGAPQLAQEITISNTSNGASSARREPVGIVVSEERIQGRLAAAHVNVGRDRGYTVVDPDAGRSDRQSANGGKRLSPSLWELFRF